MNPALMLLMRRRAGGLVFADTFDRSDGPLGSNWTAVASAVLSVSSNTAAGDATVLRLSVTAASTAANCYAQAKVTTLGGVSNGILARQSASNETGYLLRYNGSQVGLLRGNGNTSYTSLGSYTVTLSAPYTLRLECEGSTLRGIVNGVTRITVTDSTITGGGRGGLRVGLGGSDVIRFDDFEMGDL